MSTTAHLKGRIVGAAILTLFGSWWLIVSLLYWRSRPGWSVSAALAASLLLLALCVLRLVAIPATTGLRDPAAAAKGKRIGMLFGIIFGLEGGLIALCSVLLGRYHLGFWIPFVVAVIVGLHFLPLAHVFEAPIYYWTGSLCTLGVLGCLLIPAAATRLLCVGLVMNAVLWGTAIVLLGQTRHSEQRHSLTSNALSS
jgi:hypothetical protein